MSGSQINDVVKQAGNVAAHVGIALAMQAIVGFVSSNFWVGAAFAIGFYYGRERRDHEMKVEKSGGQLLAYQGWGPWEWSLDGQLDFWPPLAACLALALLV